MNKSVSCLDSPSPHLVDTIDVSFICNKIYFYPFQLNITREASISEPEMEI